MRAPPVVACALLLLVGTPAAAHRLDEYLQATTISVARDRVQAQLRLAPGVAVVPTVLASIDADADGVLSGAEQRAYAERVLRDLSLAVDGDRLPLRLVSTRFASVDELREGRGEMLIDFDAEVPRGGSSRRLTFENRHQPRIAAYLVNGLVPRDPDIRLTAQSRNYEQSSYRLEYVQAGADAGPGPPSLAWWSGSRGWLGAAALLPLAGLVALLRRRGTARRHPRERGAWIPAGAGMTNDPDSRRRGNDDGIVGEGAPRVSHVNGARTARLRR
jgi:hypothetical protein